jgi:type IV pilus assembly protein PilB
MKRVPIGQILLEDGAIDGRQLRAGLDWQKRWGGRLGNALMHLGLVKEGALVNALGRQLHVPVIDLTGRTVEESVLRLVPARIVEERKLLPVELLSETRRGPLLVATSDPLDVTGLDDAAFASGKAVRPLLAARSQLEVAIARNLGRRHPEALELPPEPVGEMDLVQPLSRDTRYWN